MVKHLLSLCRKHQEPSSCSVKRLGVSAAPIWGRGLGNSCRATGLQFTGKTGESWLWGRLRMAAVATGWVNCRRCEQDGWTCQPWVERPAATVREQYLLSSRLHSHLHTDGQDVQTKWWEDHLESGTSPTLPNILKAILHPYNCENSKLWGNSRMLLRFLRARTSEKQ